MQSVSVRFAGNMFFPIFSLKSFVLTILLVFNSRDPIFVLKILSNNENHCSNYPWTSTGNKRVFFFIFWDISRIMNNRIPLKCENMPTAFNSFILFIVCTNKWALNNCYGNRSTVVVVRAELLMQILWINVLMWVVNSHYYGWKVELHSDNEMKQKIGLLLLSLIFDLMVNNCEDIRDYRLHNH